MTQKTLAGVTLWAVRGLWFPDGTLAVEAHPAGPRTDTRDGWWRWQLAGMRSAETRTGVLTLSVWASDADANAVGERLLRHALREQWRERLVSACGFVRTGSDGEVTVTVEWSNPVLGR